MSLHPSRETRYGPGDAPPSTALPPRKTIYTDLSICDGAKPSRSSTLHFIRLPEKYTIATGDPQHSLHFAKCKNRLSACQLLLVFFPKKLPPPVRSPLRAKASRPTDDCGGPITRCVRDVWVPGSGVDLGLTGGLTARSVFYESAWTPRSIKLVLEQTCRSVHRMPVCF